jgi:hypothetical protein
MSLHSYSSTEARCRAFWQRVISAMGAVVFSVLSMLVLGMALDRWHVESVPEFRSDFFLYNNEETTCGGMRIVCGVKNHITRKPTPFVMLPLGLAPPRLLATSDDFQYDVSLMEPVDFSDDLGFGSQQSNCGSEP